MREPRYRAIPAGAASGRNRLRLLQGAEPIQIKSTQHCNIGPEALISNNPKVKPGTPKTLEELIEMFHSIKWDLGANYFIAD